MQVPGAEKPTEVYHRLLEPSGRCHRLSGYWQSVLIGILFETAETTWGSLAHRARFKYNSPPVE